MANGKKAFGVPETFMQIIGIVVFIILALAIFSFCTRVTASFKNTKDSLTILKTELEDVANNYQVGGGKSVTIKMDKKSAIIGFNPGKDVIIERDYSGIPSISLPSYEEEEYFAKIRIKRFDQCIDDSTCICACAGFSIPDIRIKLTDEKNIECEKYECINTKEFVFSDKKSISEMFEEVNTKWDSKTYWTNGIFLVRSSDESMRNPAFKEYWYERQDLLKSGEIINLDYLKLFIKKVSNPGTVELCFKDDCFDIQNVP